MHGESLKPVPRVDDENVLTKLTWQKNHPWLARRTRDIYIIRFLPWSELPTCSAAHILTQVILCPGDWYHQVLYIFSDISLQQDSIALKSYSTQHTSWENPLALTDTTSTTTVPSCDKVKRGRTKTLITWIGRALNAKEAYGEGRKERAIFLRINLYLAPGSRWVWATIWSQKIPHVRNVTSIPQTGR